MSTKVAVLRPGTCDNPCGDLHSLEVGVEKDYCKSMGELGRNEVMREDFVIDAAYLLARSGGRLEKRGSRTT